jgi:hypothetical protein
VCVWCRRPAYFDAPITARDRLCEKPDCGRVGDELAKRESGEPYREREAAGQLALPMPARIVGPLAAAALPFDW